MEDWRKEFQYLLDRKILSRDELGYLFGQIKSIIEAENDWLREALEKIADGSEDMEPPYRCMPRDVMKSIAQQALAKGGKDAKSL